MVAAITIGGLLSACGTAGYKPLPLTPIDLAGGRTGANAGFVEDAIQIEAFNLFPNAVYDTIMLESKQTKDRAKALRNIQASICDSKKPRYQPTYKIQLVSPKSQPGLLVDQIGSAKDKFLKLSREYIQARFLDDASDVALAKLDHNEDFENYQRCIVDENTNRKCGQFKARVPTSPSLVKEEYIDYYSKLKFTPMFRTFGRGETINHWREQFLAVVFPKDRLAVMTPKVGTIHQIIYNSSGEVAMSSTLVSSDSKAFDESISFSRKVHFIPSANGYMVNGLKQYPLKLASMHDLAFLKANFTFILPNEVIGQFMNLKAEEVIETTDSQYYGFDSRSQKFSPSEAIKHSNYIWTNYLKNQTKVSEAVQASGLINYELELDLSIFCTYGTPITELLSQ